MGNPMGRDSPYLLVAFFVRFVETLAVDRCAEGGAGTCANALLVSMRPFVDAAPRGDPCHCGLTARDQFEPHGIATVRQDDRLRALVAAELVDQGKQHGVLPGHPVDQRLLDLLENGPHRSREHRKILRGADQRAEQALSDVPKLIDPVGPVDIVDDHPHLEELAGVHQHDDLVPRRERTEPRVRSVPHVLRLTAALRLRLIALPIRAQSRRNGFSGDPCLVGGVEMPQLVDEAEVGILGREVGRELKPLEQQLEQCQFRLLVICFGRTGAHPLDAADNCDIFPDPGEQAPKRQRMTRLRRDVDRAAHVPIGRG